MAHFRSFSPALALALAAHAVQSSFTPIIGVFSQPFSFLSAANASNPCFEGPQRDQSFECELLPASYVKFVEAAGGRVAPVRSQASHEEIEMLVQSLNGFLFTGGLDGPLPPAVRWVLSRSFELHKAGKHLPVWGSCLGFEFLVEFMAPGASQHGFQANNISLPLQLTPAAVSSRMLGGASPLVLEALSQQNLTFNAHHRGVQEDRWEGFPALGQIFDVLSTSVDLAGRRFVSTIEGKHGLPWYGVQWHPEKNAFEQGMNKDGTPYEAISHSPEAVAVGQHMANFFVSEARRNTHRFADPEEELSRLIYGFSTSTAFRPAFVEMYFLPYPKRGSRASHVFV